MCCDKDMFRRGFHNKETVIVSQFIAKLDHITGLELRARYEYSKWADAAVLHHEAAKELYTGPGRRSLIQAVIVPTIKCRIHCAASRENALGNKIRAVTADL